MVSTIPQGSFFATPTSVQGYIEDPTHCDIYENSWNGIRYVNNNPGSDFTIFDQKVTSIGDYPLIGIGLTAHVDTLVSRPQSHLDEPDEFKLDALISANGRKGIDYQVGNAPHSAQNLNSILDSLRHNMFGGSLGTVSLGDDDGVWLENLPLQITFYGGEPTSSCTYTRMFVSSNGYISLTDEVSSPSPQFGSNTPNAIIAPFWRDLDPSAGGYIMYDWNVQSGMYIVGWVNVPDKVSGTPQEFYLVIYRDEKTCGQNDIDFVYHSVTPDAGIPTCIGIEDEHGERNTYLNQFQIQTGWDNRRRFSATSPPMYLSSLKIELYDFGDDLAAMTFDQNVMGGANMKIKDPIDIEILPQWFSTAASDAAFITPIFGTAGAAGGLIVDGILLGIENYEVLLEHYANMETTEVQDAQQADSCAWTKAFCEERFGVRPTDASFVLSFWWLFYDKGIQQLREHKLLVTAIAGYSPSWNTGGSEQWFDSTSVELTMTPGDLLRPYEDGSNWDPSWDSNPLSGYDCWGSSESRVYSGGNSYWCAGNNDGTQGQDLYDNNMDSYRQSIWLGPQLQYSTLYLYFKAWVDTEQYNDWLSLEYLDSRSNNWNELIRLDGRISTLTWRSHNESTQWLSMRTTLPDTALKIRFRFYSDSANVYQGVYLDEIMLLGIPRTGTPKCAMKTMATGQVAGRFYIPDAPLNPAFQNFFMIHTVFGHGLVGDQNGIIPDTYLFSFPDGKVNILDITMMAIRFGSRKGDTNWSYMADVNNDGVINIVDIANVAINFGTDESYIMPNYSQITVEFTGGIGGIRSPDWQGFVEIPNGATAFTVYDNGIATGAMVAFFNPIS